MIFLEEDQYYIQRGDDSREWYIDARLVAKSLSRSDLLNVIYSERYKVVYYYNTSLFMALSILVLHYPKCNSLRRNRLPLRFAMRTPSRGQIISDVAFLAPFTLFGMKFTIWSDYRNKEYGNISYRLEMILRYFFHGVNYVRRRHFLNIEYKSPPLLI